MAEEFSIGFDPDSLRIITRFAGFEADITPELMSATQLSLDAVENYAVGFMFANFKNPQGPLEGAFYQVVTPGVGSVQGELINPLPYAWRREKGFVRMVDTRGRVGTDVGIGYMENSLIAQTSVIEGYFIGAMDAALMRLGAA